MRYLDFLLLADEQEDMIDCCLDRGNMYLLTCGGWSIWCTCKSALANAGGEAC